MALEALSQFSTKSQNRHLYHFSALVEASSATHWSTTLEVPKGEWSDMKVAEVAIRFFLDAVVSINFRTPRIKIYHFITCIANIVPLF